MEALQSLELQYRTTLDSMKEAVHVVDTDLRFVLFNEKFKQWNKELGLKTDVIGRTILEAFPFLPQTVNDEYHKVFESGKVLVTEERNRIGSREIITETQKIPVFEDGKVVKVVTIIKDITSYKQAIQSLEKSQESYRKLIESANDAIFIANAETSIILDCNKKASELLGMPVENIIGMHQSQLHPPEEADYYQRIFQDHVKGGGPIRDVCVCRSDGSRIWVDISANVYEADGKKFILGIFRDITERKQAERDLEKLNKELLQSNSRLRKLALRDHQTGLYNHRYLSEIIEAELYRAHRYGHPLSVIMLDIDYFKSINDVYGHLFGDLVLKQFSRQIKRLVRRYDIVIRYGGEEFVIVSPGIDRANAFGLAQRILDAINLYNFGNSEHTVKLNLSITVVSYPEDRVNKGADLIELAEHILDKVKEYGGNSVYSSVDTRKTRPSAIKNGKTKGYVDFLKKKVDKLTKRANQSLMEAIFAFAKTIELKDQCTGSHVEKTVHFATEIARAMGLSKEEIDRIKQACILHDLGKVGISDKILLKKGKLTKKEFEEVKKHPQIGVDIIRPVKFMHDIIPFILYHHERWDGKGYPNGLKREDIPVGARIIAVADVFQALISHRPYRRAFAKKDAIEIIKKGSGTQFDPAVVDWFMKVIYQV